MLSKILIFSPSGIMSPWYFVTLVFCLSGILSCGIFSLHPTSKCSMSVDEEINSVADVSAQVDVQTSSPKLKDYKFGKNKSKVFLSLLTTSRVFQKSKSVHYSKNGDSLLFEVQPIFKEFRKDLRIEN